MSVLANIRDTLISMKDILFLCGIKDKQIEKLIILLMKVENEEQLQEFLNWLQKIHDGPVKEVRDIYSLKPPDWWDNMRVFGVDHTREFRLLATAKKKLRAAWRTKYEQKDESSDSDSDQEDVQQMQIPEDS